MKEDYREAALSPRERAMADYAVKITRDPAAGTPEDLDRLRTHGLSDADLLDLVHVVGYFNHINRLAEALGVDLEEFMPPPGRWPRA